MLGRYPSDEREDLVRIPSNALDPPLVLILFIQLSPPLLSHHACSNAELPQVDLTSSIVVTGLSAVSTDRPTDQNAPWVISYDVQDNAVPPNKAKTARRRVEVP